MASEVSRGARRTRRYARGRAESERTRDGRFETPIGGGGGSGLGTDGMDLGGFKQNDALADDGKGGQNKFVVHVGEILHGSLCIAHSAEIPTPL